jgi:asparagine synthase (glutamine-hydrolysing)
MRGIAPDRVIDNRRKVGFNAPVHAFLDTKDPEVRAELLADSPVFEHVRKDRIEELLDRNWLPNSESKFLFYFLNAKLFLEEFEG